jgi:hypothetical protein
MQTQTAYGHMHRSHLTTRHSYVGYRTLDGVGDKRELVCGHDTALCTRHDTTEGGDDDDDDDDVSTKPSPRSPLARTAAAEQGAETSDGVVSSDVLCSSLR